ncbi:MAG: choice-of-anchor D domain-containing protein [Alphaproteobacteria bacterium]|nr:choice-of-anchor D domain-containing protein [Alphaproteobacteria bacterium]
MAIPLPVFAQSAFEDPGVRGAAAGKGGDLSAVEAKIDAGSVALGSASQVVVLLRNDGTKPITSGSISLYPSSNVSASVGENECIQQALPPAAVCAIAISVKGLQPGKFRIEMLMRHDGRSKLITATISGTVERSDDATNDIISDLDTIPSELKFQTLKDSRPLTRSVILRNVTSKEINISSMEIQSNDQAGYSLSSDCEKLLSGEACIATVTWAPKQRGPATGVIIVNHDGPTGVVSVLLDGDYEPDQAQQVGVFPEAVPGKGLLTASQTDVDFGNGIETTSAITVSLVNVGDAPLSISDIRLSNKDNGIKVAEGGCSTKTVLAPVEACPLTLTWDPVREGAILDDVQVMHDGARGILVLPIRGMASKAVNKDTKAIVYNDLSAADILAAIPSIPASQVEAAPARQASNTKADPSGALEGYKVTSLAKNRAIISGPGGSRVVSDNQETVIGGVLWRISIRPNAVEFFGSNQRILLLFDHSLSFSNDNSSREVTATSSSEATN